MNEALAAASREAGLAWPIRWVAVTTSTNADLRALAEQGAPHGTALVAGAQTAGRGRLGRVWETPAGSLALSVLLRPLIPVEHAGLVALATARVVAEACGPSYGIKWPNDVLGPGGEKVAGILAEMEVRERRVRWVVVGIGVNLDAPPPDVPGAGGLQAIDGVARNPASFAATLVAGLVAMSARLARSPAAELDAWRARAVTLGRRVRVGDKEGRAEDVASDGALLLREDDGTLCRVVSGDVLPT